ncbi:MAG TPA: serine/threonine-protein kinase, partial [Povalibacter sp.]|nr:serine/threonine-protein kinase [Povalibacter sp.]
MSVSERPATRLWREALAQLDQLLQQSPAEQQRCLTDIAQSQPQLHSVLVSLLEAEARAESSGFLDPPSSRASVSLQPGAQLGPYRIDSQIGSGGMGEVWLARRVDGLYEGDVAIKTLHPYFGGGALRERFLREAQILGRLTHPNIARLLDAGVAPDGSVYLVLEYVRGVSVDTWCDERRLGIEARLRLFLEVCAAVAQAHANLVVHRDIKPSNILVTGEGDVKLLDFGVAKLVEGETGIERTELTRMTGRIFTPEYAAPEQVMGETITTATDVYALGVLLHVLLTATRPYGKSDNTIEIERAVLHDEPVRPSRAVDSDGAAEIAERRSTTPARLQRSLAGDLDNIIGRALRKAPADRYASVLEFADDVRRHLEHKPIRAQAEPLIARARKFVRRHRVGAAASALIVLVVAAGIAGVLWQSHVAREQAVIAAQEAQKAAAVRDFLLDIFNSNSESHPDGARARQTTAEELLDIASRNILGSVDQDPGVRLELMGTMGRLNLILEKYEQTEALQRERVRFATERLGPSDTRTLEAMLDLGVFLRQRGSYDEARASVESAIRIMEDIGDRSSLLRGRA